MTRRTALRGAAAGAGLAELSAEVVGAEGVDDHSLLMMDGTWVKESDV